MSKLNRSVYQSLAMIGQFGIYMLVPVLACAFLGMVLDRKLGTSYLVIILFFVGAAAGFRNVYRFARRISDGASSTEAYLHEGRKKAGKRKPPEGTEEQSVTDSGQTGAGYEDNHHENKQDII